MLHVGEGIKLRNRKIIEWITLVRRTLEDHRTMIQARICVIEKMRLIVIKDQTDYHDTKYHE